MVVGHSLGGQIALELALREPAWPRAVVLAAASGISSARPGRRRALNVSTAVRPARLEPTASGPGSSLTAPQGSSRSLGWSLISTRSQTPSAEEFFVGAATAATTRPAYQALIETDPRTAAARHRHSPSSCSGERATGRCPMADGIDYARRLGGRLRTPCRHRDIC